MDNESPALIRLLMSWAPILLLVGFWWWLMRKGGPFGKSAQQMDRNVAFMERQEKLLERIAVALEERNRQRS